MAFAAIAAIMLLIGAIAAGGVASWVVFAIVLFIVVRLFFGGGRRRARARHRRRERWAMPVDEVPVPPPAPPPPLAPPPQPVVQLNQLPAGVKKQVDRIQRKARVLGQHADRFPLGSKDLYVVQHTASDYLPTTVSAYQEVPSWSVNTPAPDGRTPLQMLESQLDLLETKLDEIAEHVRNQRVDNLLANERFLEENFGKPDAEELTLPR